MESTTNEFDHEPSRPKRFQFSLLNSSLLNPKVVVPLIILPLLLFVAPFIFRFYRVNLLPDIGHPFDVEAFGSVSIPDEENSFVEYRQASDLLVELESAADANDELDRALEEGWSAASENIRNWVDSNPAAMELCRQGAEKPDALYHEPRNITYTTQLPVTQSLRELARLMLLEGSRLQNKEQFEDAWQWYRTMYRLSRHSGRYGSMIERLVGVVLLDMSAQGIDDWSRSPLVTSDQLGRSIKELQTVYQMTTPTSTSYQVEYLALLSAIEDGYAATESQSVNIPLGGFALYFLGETELSIRVAQHLWTKQLALIDKPLHERPAQTAPMMEADDAPATNGVASDEMIDKALRHSVLTQLLLPATWHFDEAILREQVQHRALLVTLAAQQFQRDHDEFPATANELLDGYLEQIPLDPHDVTGTALRYRRDPDGFTVWGIGADRTDDGGEIDWDADAERDFGFRVVMGSRASS